MRQVDVWVPLADTSAAALIAPGSGIVGELIRDPHGAGEDRVSVYYEGNLHGYSNVVTFADRCEQAAGRMWERYPTVARAVLPAVELRRVGVFTEGHGVDIENVQQQIAITRWIAGAQATIGSLRHHELRLSRTSYAAGGVS